MELLQSFMSLNMQSVRNSTKKKLCKETSSYTRQNSKQHFCAFLLSAVLKTPLFRYDMNIGDNRSSKKIKNLRSQRYIQPNQNKLQNICQLPDFIECNCPKAKLSSVVFFSSSHSRHRSSHIVCPFGHYREASSRSNVAERINTFNNFIHNNRNENRNFSKHEFELYVKVSNPLVNRSEHHFHSIIDYPINQNRYCEENINDELSLESKDLRLAANSQPENAEHTRVYTSVKFVLRPPSSEPRVPIDIRSQGPNLVYSTSSIDPRGFESRLRISIGSTNSDSVVSTQMKSQMGHIELDSSPEARNYHHQSIGTEQRERMIHEQIQRKERLADELKAEKRKLQSMRKDLQALTKAPDPRLSYENLKKKLRSEIYQLQIECDRLTEEVDRKSDPRVPLGETNVEFYQGIYTGQPFHSSVPSSIPRPPLPLRPPACELGSERVNFSNNDRDGASWICRMCTFNNHPLMDQCEQCDMRKFSSHNTGTTSTIFEITRAEVLPSTSEVMD